MTEASARRGLESPDYLQTGNHFRAPVQQYGRCRTIFGSNARPELLRIWRGTFDGSVDSALNISQEPVVIFRGRRDKQEAVLRQVFAQEVHDAIFAQNGAFGFLCVYGSSCSLAFGAARAGVHDRVDNFIRGPGR